MEETPNDWTGAGTLADFIAANNGDDASPANRVFLLAEVNPHANPVPFRGIQDENPIVVKRPNVKYASHHLIFSVVGAVINRFCAMEFAQSYHAEPIIVENRMSRGHAHQLRAETFVEEFFL